MDGSKLPGPRRRTGRPGKPEKSAGVSSGSSARPGLRVEDCRPRGQCMDVSSIAVTGASGLVGQRLLPVLADHPDVDAGRRARRARARTAAPATLEFHRVDIAGTELKPLLEGIDVDRAPRRRRRPDPRRGADGAGQRRGHAARARRRGGGGRDADRAHLERDRVRRVAEQPGAAHRGRAAAPEPALLAGGAGRRGRAAARRVARRPPRRDRHHAALGAGRRARAPNGSRRASCSAGRRCGSGARRCRCRSSTSTTSRPRSRSRPPRDLPGVYNVAADGWLDADDARALLPRVERARVPGRGARARAARAPGRSASATCRPGVVPYLVHPWVIANDKLQGRGLGAPRTPTRRRSARRVATLPPRRVPATDAAGRRRRCRRCAADRVDAVRSTDRRRTRVRSLAARDRASTKPRRARLRCCSSAPTRARPRRGRARRGRTARSRSSTPRC